jgi:hypothetical protein
MNSPRIEPLLPKKVEPLLPKKVRMGGLWGPNRERCVSYFTLRTIVVLMETMKDFYSSTTIPPSAAVATRPCDLRVNDYTA